MILDLCYEINFKRYVAYVSTTRDLEWLIMVGTVSSCEHNVDWYWIAFPVELRHNKY